MNSPMNEGKQYTFYVTSPKKTYENYKIGIYQLLIIVERGTLILI